jgi:hypothetical protein
MISPAARMTTTSPIIARPPTTGVLCLTMMLRAALMVI